MPETILKGFDGLVTIFVLGDPDVKAGAYQKGLRRIRRGSQAYDEAGGLEQEILP